MQTIQWEIDNGYQIGAHCGNPDCRHYGLLDLHKLGRRLGYDHSAMRDELVPHLRCPRCGSKDIAITISAVNTGPR
ncbi:MAG: hypothetical protein BGN85_08910 [Alphaproteobacteria bacterium 64-11]|nr:MAG: hypothetical protein BGN85_08910 [Alphaproteobacteria bacterium 64-11]